MEDWEISASKAEEIYEKRQQLNDLKNYLIKLDVKRTMYADDPQKSEEFEARYYEMKQKFEDLQSEIDQM